MWFGISAAIGNTIAAGIVRAPGDIAQWLPNVYLFFGVWVAGGLYALSGASSLAELGAAIPRSGGQYNFSRRALGEYAGFIVGWSDWLSTCGTAAAVAIVIGEYSGELIPAIAGHVKLIAVLIIIGFFVLQWRGIKGGSGTQLATAAMKTFAFVIVVAACFLWGGHARAAVTSFAAAPPLPSGWPLALAILFGLQAVFYSIDGWDGIIYFGEEVRNPGRDVPRAIFGSVATIMGIYLLINGAVLYVLPMSQIAGNTFVLGTAAERIFGPYGDTIIRAIMVISLLSCLNANQLFCSRTLYAMSCDRLFFRSFTRVNRGGTPTLSLLLSTAVGVLFVLGSFEIVIAMLSFFFVGNGAALSRVGLPVDDRDCVVCFGAVSDCVDCPGPEDRAHNRESLAAQPRDAGALDLAAQLSRISAAQALQREFRVADLSHKADSLRPPEAGRLAGAGCSPAATSRRLHLFRNRFGLQEQQQIVFSAGFGIGT